MNKEKFVKYATEGGYCTKREAEIYAESKTNFSEDDFVQVSRLHERKEIQQKKKENPEVVGMKPIYGTNGITTKKYRYKERG